MTYIYGLPYLNTEPTTTEDAEHKLGTNPEVLCSLEMTDEEESIEMNKICLEEAETKEFTMYINYLSQYDMSTQEEDEGRLISPFSMVSIKMTHMGNTTLWHHYMAHNSYVSNTRQHKELDGIPKLTVPHKSAYTCPACIMEADLPKAPM